MYRWKTSLPFEDRLQTACGPVSFGLGTCEVKEAYRSVGAIATSYMHVYIYIYIYICNTGHRVSRPRGTGSVGVGVGEGQSASES